MAYHSIPAQPGSGSSSSSGSRYLSSPFGDTTYTKVFVGGLAWETQSDTLRHYFEQYGDILEAVVITDKNSGRSKGYGFVSLFFCAHLILFSLCTNFITILTIERTMIIWLFEQTNSDNKR